MYTTAFQEQLDQQSMLSRFYSMRSQANTTTGADFESFHTYNSLSDAYAMDSEKLLYLRMNYKRLYGREPESKVYRYTGQMPGIEDAYAQQYNQTYSRFTSEDFKHLGDILYKGLKGMIGMNADSLESEKVRRLKAIAMSSRMGVSDGSLLSRVNVPGPDTIRPSGLNVMGDTAKPSYFQYHQQMQGIDRQQYENSPAGDLAFGMIERKYVPQDTQNLMFTAGGIEPSKQMHRLARTQLVAEEEKVPVDSSATLATKTPMVTAPATKAGNRPTFMRRQMMKTAAEGAMPTSGAKKFTTTSSGGDNASVLGSGSSASEESGV